jgi:hypothetical protein
MAYAVPHDHPLFRLFRGFVEHAFCVRLGVANPALTDYLAEMLARFVHIDCLYALRNSGGRPLQEVAEMLMESWFPEPMTFQQRRAVLHKHVGDFTLFWTGVYPEGLARLRAAATKDRLIDYVAQGKRSYHLAAEAERPAQPTEAVVLDELADRFESCAAGLGLARRGWEDSGAAPRLMV